MARHNSDTFFHVTKTGVQIVNVTEGYLMQDILGHADAETTLQIYTDATKDLKKSEMINFGDYFKVQKKR